MKLVKLLVFGMVVAWSLPSLGFLPPDFKYRQKEYVQRRVNERAAYEQREREYEKSLIDQRIRVEAAMKQPLWEPVRVDEKSPAKEENRPVRRKVVETEQVTPKKVSEPVVVPAQVAKNISIQKPPRRNADENKVERVNDETPLMVEGKEPKLNHRFLILIVLLILTGIAAGWAWYKTRKTDK